MAWDKTKPAGSQKIRLSDEEIRANWEAIDAILAAALAAGDPLLIDEDDMASDSDTQAPTQQSVKAFVESGTVAFSNKDFEQDGNMTVKDTGDTTSEEPFDILTENLDDAGDAAVRIGQALSSKNSAKISFHKVAADDAGNYAEYGLYGVTGIRVDGSGNVGVGKTSEGAKLDVDGEVEATALDINGNADIGGDLDVTGGLTVDGKNMEGYGPFDLTCAMSGQSWTTTSAKAIFYEDPSGNWRMKFNIHGTISPGQSPLYLDITNVASSSTIYQAVAAFGVSYAVRARFTSNRISAWAGGAETVYAFSGDVALNAQPTGFW
jgi:hypothetical protein